MGNRGRPRKTERWNTILVPHWLLLEIKKKKGSSKQPIYEFLRSQLKISKKRIKQPKETRYV